MYKFNQLSPEEFWNLSPEERRQYIADNHDALADNEELITETLAKMGITDIVEEYNSYLKSENGIYHLFMKSLNEKDPKHESYMKLLGMFKHNMSVIKENDIDMFNELREAINIQFPDDYEQDLMLKWMGLV